MSNTTEMSNTAEMSQDLRDELERLGWGGKLDRVIWGRRVSGDAHGATIERGGVTRHYAAPFSCVRRGDQIAIVRFG